jgi:hypothetical protein
VLLAQCDNMVGALATDRSDQPLGEAVLPRRTWGDGFVPDGHGPQSTYDGRTVDRVPIADQVARSLIPRECLHNLACNPFRGRICGDVDPDKVAACQPDDDEGVEQVEANSWNNGCGRAIRSRPSEYQHAARSALHGTYPHTALPRSTFHSSVTLTGPDDEGTPGLRW